MSKIIISLLFMFILVLILQSCSYLLIWEKNYYITIETKIQCNVQLIENECDTFNLSLEEDQLYRYKMTLDKFRNNYKIIINNDTITFGVLKWTPQHCIVSYKEKGNILVKRMRISRKTL